MYLKSRDGLSSVCQFCFSLFLLVSRDGLSSALRFDNNNVIQLPPTYVRQAPIFGFVAHKIPVNGNVENSCHMFAELDPGNLI
uniref:Uncharacterized protein n=1 Tax=Meloidogyne incognita TaxID=6306 RepID=A0A914MB63_MELIC